MSTEFVTGNRIDLLVTGADFFPALLQAIDSATLELYLETYIFEDDETGRLIATALARAARRGVVVRVMVDGFGANHFAETLMPALSSSGADVLVYRPEIARFKFRRHRLRRLHRKLAVIDARLAFVGGINIGDDIDDPAVNLRRCDYTVRIAGPLIAHIHASVRHLWGLVSWASFKHRLRVLHHPQVMAGRCGEMQASFVVRDNLRHRRDIEDSYLEAINTAKHEIILANAYFLPGRRFRHALLNAAQRGVTVTLLLQGRVEYVLQHYATQALYGALLNGGIRIFEYHRSLLHAKVAAVDGSWATIGSSNIDPFSLLLAREANIVVRDTNFTGQLRDSLRQAMQTGAGELKVEDLKRRSFIHHAASWLCYNLVRIMIGLAGYGGKH